MPRYLSSSPSAFKENELRHKRLAANCLNHIKKKKKKKIEVEMNKHKNITHICISRRLALSPTKVLNVCIRKKKT
jgi:hypothetical protein